MNVIRVSNNLLLQLVFFALIFLMSSCRNSPSSYVNVERIIRDVDSLNIILNNFDKLDKKQKVVADSLFNLSLSIDYEKGISESAVSILKHFLDYSAVNESHHFLLNHDLKLNSLSLDDDLGQLVYMMGSTYLMNANFTKSLEHLLRAKEIITKEKDTKLRAKICSKLSSLYWIIGNEDKSKVEQDEASDLWESLDDLMGMSAGIHNKALIIQDYDENRALNSFEVARRINEKNKYWNYWLRNLASIVQLDSNSVVEYDWLRVDSLYKSDMDIETKEVVGFMYYAVRENKKSLAVFKDIIAESNLSGNIRAAKSAYKSVLENYKALSVDDSTSKYLGLYFDANDSIQVMLNTAALIKTESAFIGEQKFQQHLEKSYKKKIWFILALLSFLFVLLYLRNSMLRQKHTLMINELALDSAELKLNAKSSELAAFVLAEIKQTELKKDTVSQLKILRNGIGSRKQDELNTIIKKLEIRDDFDLWIEFERKFHAAHPNFKSCLKIWFEIMTTNEKRLCVLLSLDMSTKEIASVTGQTASAVEQARTRIRKKFGIDHKQVSLSSHINNIVNKNI